MNRNKPIGPFLMAPIAEITTPALRQAVRKFSSDVTIYSEMISATALLRGGLMNQALVSKYDFDDPFIYQLIGTDSEAMAEAATLLEENSPLGIDINMGCSAPDISKKGWGSKLLTDIKLAEQIVKRCRQAVKGSLSVKIRAGYESMDKKYLLKFASMLENSGVDFITLHPRHGRMAFKRSADWSYVKFLKENLSIPVIGNGDISSAESALKKMSDSGCDGVMIARQAITSPWIFKKCLRLLNGDDSPFDVNIENVAMDVLSSLEEFLPEELHKSRGRRFCGYYCKNMTFGHKLAGKIRHVDEIGVMKALMKDYFDRNPDERIKSI